MIHLRAGNLRTRVQIQHRVESRDETGQADGEWKTLAHRHAHILTQAGDERRYGEQTQGVLDSKVWLQFDTVTRQLRPQMRLLVTTDGQPDRILNIIRAHDADGLRRVMECLCSEEAG